MIFTSLSSFDSLVSGKMDDILNIFSIEIIAALLLVVIGTISLLGRFFTSSGSSDTAVLLLGPCGSGKTSLFSHLRARPRPDTVTSQTVNRTVICLDEKKNQQKIEIIDYPGHPRLWAGAASIVPKVSKIIYLVDACKDPSCLKRVAEHLYDLLVLKNLPRSARMLICRNKTDGSVLIDDECLEATLNKEIDLLRKSRAQELEGENAADQFLGFDDEHAFDLKIHAPISIDFGSCSVVKSRISDIEKFLRSS